MTEYMSFNGLVLAGYNKAGEQTDEVTGLYYLRSRQYDTVIGRFTQEDTYIMSI